MGTPGTPKVTVPFSIHDRIGPIFDPAFLRLIREEQMKEITLIMLRAELGAQQQYTRALESVVKTVEGIKVQG